MKYLVIYWIWVDCTILVPYEKLHFCDFTKKYLDEIFHSNKYKCVEKQINWQISVIWKITRIMLEVFVSKFILYVYQHVKENQRITTPK